MSSTVQRNGEWVRPTWKYPAQETQAIHCSILEMLESIRNFLEGCQMMQCDVAQSIKRQEEILKRIERNTRRKRRKVKR